MPQNLLYLRNLESSQSNFVDIELEPVALDKLSGLFAYILFKDIKLLVICNLTDYQSNHSGINLIQKALKKKLIEKSLYKSIDITLPRDDPDFGGEILLLKGETIFWNFKSRSYSEKHPELNDSSLELKEQIEKSGLSPERFISIKKAEYFERAYLRLYFASNGQYHYNPYQTIQLLSMSLDLSPLLNRQNLQDVPKPAGAGSRESCSLIMSANSTFSFFNRALKTENQALLIEPISPKL